MKHVGRARVSVFLSGSLIFAASLGLGPSAQAATNFILLGWSEAGMYFVDTDYSVFSIHPLGSTLHAQIIENVNGNQALLMTNAAAAGITVTYEAVADPDGSINSTSTGKNNFWEYALPLYGSNLAADAGFGAPMPGVSNTPQTMTFSTDYYWFTAANIPVTPYDDAGKLNTYPLFKLVAKVGGNAVTNISVVLPVTDELDCRLCHASGANTAAAPVAGWANDPNPERDYRLNILRVHDQRQSTNPVYAVALATNGYSSAGLYAHVTVSNKPVLCINCHSSTYLPGRGATGVEPFTQAIHTHHAAVIDPRTGLVLDSETNRATCYTCHGGGDTHFLRGAMGNADSTSGVAQLVIQCQSCHGTMAMVGATNRIGWLSMPNCQACHVGDALTNFNGQIRFTSALTGGVLRVPASTRFATDPNVPSNGLSLFHLSTGHSNIMCSACHGPPHAEFPTSTRNDNIRSFQVQGHNGVMAECEVCHGSQDLNQVAGGGPHGLHPHNYEWANGNSAGGHSQYETLQACGPCHGTNSSFNKRGTILSYSRGDRSFAGLPIGGDITFWQGELVGCTHCHSGTAAPTVASTGTNTSSGVAVTFTLTSSTNNVRIVSQGSHGLVGLANKAATYAPAIGFFGTDTFVFASAKAQLESASATGTVVVTQVFTVGDGIPDWWRANYFGGDGKTTNAASCATADPDGDGLNNNEEYFAGTDPTDDGSVLRVFAAQKTNNDMRFGFATTVSKRYAVEYSTNLPSGIWVPVASNVWGRTITAQATDTNGAGQVQRVYRVRVQ